MVAGLSYAQEASMTTFPALEEAEGRLKAKRDELGAIFAEAGPDLDFTKVKSISGAHTSRDVAAKVRELNDEMTDIAKEVADLQGAKKAAEAVRSGGVSAAVESGGSDAGSQGFKSFGEMFTKSEAYVGQGYKAHRSANLDMDLKALFATTAGWAPEVLRNGRVVESAQRPIQVADIIPQTTTGQNSVKYMEETTFTNAAAETAEGGAYIESALALTEKISPVQKIATFIPVTDEQLEDEQAAAGYLNNRLPFFLRQRLDAQILTGNGTAPNLRGLLNVVGIQTQAKGTDPGPDAVYKAMVKVQTGSGQALPNAALFAPLDWQNVRLLRTADGIYIWGNPSDAGPQSIWGLQAVVVQALTAGTAVVGDFANFSELAVRRGVEVQVSNSHADYFVNGKQALRADIRVALTFYRPAAFCTVTGL